MKKDEPTERIAGGGREALRRHVAADATILRGWLLAIILLGLVGSAVELVLLEHYEDSWQLVPLVVIGAALGAIALHLLVRTAATVHVLRGVMVAMVISGALGIVLHYRGALEFQLEMDPTQSRWTLFTKVLHSKAPPALAPGLMAQLGLLGLLYAYRHPAARRELD